MKKRFLTLLFLLCVSVSASAAPTFTVITANLQHGAGTDSVTNYTRQITALAGADLIAVQERTTGDIGWNTPMSSASLSEAIYRENDAQQGDGPAIWYKTSTVTLNAVYSTALQATNLIGWDGSTTVNKSAVAVKVTVGGKQFYFVSTHLCWSACADSSGSLFSSQREGQINTLLSWINSTLTGGLDVVIAGDMNFGPDYPKNGGGLIKDLFTASYVDLWNLGLSLSKATTPWGDRDGNTVADMTPADLGTQTTGTRTHDTRRIDYIFLKNGATGLTLKSISVPDSRATCSVALTNIKPTAGTSLVKECPDVNDTLNQGLWDITDDQGVRPSDHNFVKAVFAAQSCHPPDFCARTDLLPITMPTQTVPTLNGNFIDTIASKKVVRVTSATVLSSLDTAYNNHRYQVTSSSEQNAWSKPFTSSGQTHSRFYFERTEGGTTHFLDIDESTGTGTLINGWGNAAWGTATNFPATSGGTWSYTNDGYFYAHDNSTNTTLKKYDFNAHTITTIKDWSSGCGVTLSGGHLGEPTVDVTDTYFSTYGGGSSQDNDTHVVVWKAGVGGGCRYLNTQAGTVGGDWGTTGSVAMKNADGTSDGAFSSFFIHNARLSPDGSYVRITNVGGTTIYVWDVNSLDLKKCVGTTDRCFGHMGWAWNRIVNQENSAADAIRYATRAYTDMSIAGLTYVANPTISPAENMADSHLSSAYSNAQQAAILSCGAAYRTDGSPPNGSTPYQRTHRPFDNEIFCITLNDGVGATMFRFTHTFTSSRLPATEAACSSVSRSGSTITATCTSHGLTNGQTAVFTHTASNALDGFCTNAVVTGANTFTCTDESSGTVAAGTARVSLAGTGEFNQLPRGNMSQDGRFYAFASDFMGQLGNTSGGSCAPGTTCRTDVFIVELAPLSTFTICRWSASPACQSQ